MLTLDHIGKDIPVVGDNSLHYKVNDIKQYVYARYFAYALILIETHT